MVLDGLLRQGLAIWLAVVIAEPSEVLGDVNAWNVRQGDTFKLRKYHFEDVRIHSDCGGAVRAVPHTQGEPHFIDKPIKGIRAGGGEARYGVFLLFFEVRLPSFLLHSLLVVVWIYVALINCGRLFIILLTVLQIIALWGLKQIWSKIWERSN